MRRGARCALGLGLAFAAFSPSLWAEPAAAADEQPLRIQYDAHQGCPDALGFFWHVRARTRRVRLAEEGELAILVSVRIDRELTESVGVLEMPGPESRPFERHVRASSCEEVVLALSLVLALAYDPDAVQTFPAALPEAVPPAPPPPPPAPEKPCPPPPAENPPSRAAFGVDGLLMTGVSPEVHPAVSAFLEFGRFGTWFAPAMSAGVVWAPRSDTSIGGTNSVARFGYWGGRITLCPVVWRPARRVELSPCLGADFGRLTASTDYPVPLPEESSTFWGKGFLQARIRWNFWGRFFGETFGGGGVTFTHDRFAVTRSGNQETPVLEVRSLAADVGIGVGAYFP
jgi:hypothetical protein